jgi:outer membrane immunogenic protein
MGNASEAMVRHLFCHRPQRVELAAGCAVSVILRNVAGRSHSSRSRRDTAVAGLAGECDVMLKAVSAAAIVVLTAANAFAADLPMKAPVKAPVAPPQLTWTGCFAGVHAGGAFGDDQVPSSVGLLSSGDFGSAGFIGGGQIGCDYQFASVWVVGVEGRAAWSSLNSNTALTGTTLGGFTFPTHFTVGNDFLASATARVGYSFVGGWLVYAKGGAAWTREKADDSITFPAVGLTVDPRATTTQTGWTAGAGLDWAFAPHWSTNFE